MYYEAEFARPNLDTYLQRLYHDESELIAIFLCTDYDQKGWCGLEWRALRDLIKQRQSSSIMLFRFDNTEIPGLFSIDGYVWIGDKLPKKVAELTLQRLAGMPVLAREVPQPELVEARETSARPARHGGRPTVDLTRLPAGAADFLGRDEELRLLDDAWADADRAKIVELVASGGMGMHLWA